MRARDIRLVMEGKPRNLIETVACDIATNILQDYREVKGLKISVQKPHVALDGVVKSMGEASMLEGGLQGDRFKQGLPLRCPFHFRLRTSM